MKYEDAIVRNFIVKLATYAVGRGITYMDMPVIREIEREAAKNNYRFTNIVMGIVKSPPFQMKMAEPTEAGIAAAVRPNAVDRTRNNSAQR